MPFSLLQCGCLRRKGRLACYYKRFHREYYVYLKISLNTFKSIKKDLTITGKTMIFIVIKTIFLLHLIAYFLRDKNSQTFFILIWLFKHIFTFVFIFTMYFCAK